MKQQRIDSWSEPPTGSHAIWQKDPWRYQKMFLIPLVLFCVAAWRRLDMSSVTVLWLAAIAFVLMALLWAWSFAPRMIRVCEDEVAIGRLGRGLSWSAICFSTVAEVEVVPFRSFWRVRLRVNDGTVVDFFAPDEDRARSVKRLFDRTAEPNQSLQPNAGAAPFADAAPPPRG
jgi:hypothetical protein